MEKPVRIKEEDALKRLETFNDDKQSIVISSADENGVPFVSYSPFVEDKDFNMYIIISGGVKHAHNLSKTKQASIMTIQDESQCKNIYARERFYGLVEAEKFEENDSREAEIMELFVAKFGPHVKMLTKMPDFRIYKLVPKEANLVLGFGSAYSVSVDRKSINIKNAEHEQKHEKHI